MSGVKRERPVDIRRRSGLFEYVLKEAENEMQVMRPGIRKEIQTGTKLQRVQSQLSKVIPGEESRKDQ
jgi:hypothetical protein